MKKISLYLLALLALPTLVFGAGSASSVFRDTSGFIRPIITTDSIKASFFTATSTTATSTFPVASSTKFCISNDCRVSWTTDIWPFTTGLENFGVSVQATTTPEWFQGGLHASSTSHMASTTFYTQNDDGFRVMGSATNHLGLMKNTGSGAAHISFCNEDTGCAITDGVDFGMRSTANGNAMILRNREAAGLVVQVNGTNNALTIEASGLLTYGAASTTDLTTSNSLHLSQLTGYSFIGIDQNEKVVAIATSTAYGTGTGGYVLAWANGAPSWQATSTCEQITGSADLCDGNDASGAGGAAWPFTPDSYLSVANQSTTTPLWLKNTMVIASTTFFTRASTTMLTNTGSAWFTGLTGPAPLAITSTGLVYAAATTTAGDPTGSIGSTSATNGTSVTYMRSDAVPACTVATASAPGCLAAADFATFASKITLSNLFTQDTSYGGATLSTTTKSWWKNGLQASSTSYFVNATSSQWTVLDKSWFTGLASFGAASTTDLTTSNSLHLSQLTGYSMIGVDQNEKVIAVATSTAYGTGTAGYVLAWANGVPMWQATSTCEQITGSAALCDGDDASGGGGGGTPSKWATSTVDSNAIYPAGATKVGIGTSTPWGLLSLVTNENIPSFVIATSTNAVPLLYVSTSSMGHSGRITTYNFQNQYASVAIGAQTQFGMKFRDTLFVNGRINSGEWSHIECAMVNGIFTTQLVADTSNICNGFNFAEDTAAVFDAILQTTGRPVLRIFPGTNGTVAATGDGAAVNMGAGMFDSDQLGTSTPVMQMMFRMDDIEEATSSIMMIGFSDAVGASANFAAEPTLGFYLIATSGRANWLGACNGTSGATNYVDTGVPSSTVMTGDEDRFRLARVELVGLSSVSATANFFIASSSMGSLTESFAAVTCSAPVAVANNNFVSPFFSVGRVTGGLSPGITGASLRLWWYSGFFF